jgi:hypothetical protein
MNSDRAVMYDVTMNASILIYDYPVRNGVFELHKLHSIKWEDAVNAGLEKMIKKAVSGPF